MFCLCHEINLSDVSVVLHPLSLSCNVCVLQEFAHCVLAGDVATARKMLRLSQKLKININFRNMVSRGCQLLMRTVTGVGGRGSGVDTISWGQLGCKLEIPQLCGTACIAE